MNVSNVQQRVDDKKYGREYDRIFRSKPVRLLEVVRECAAAREPVEDDVEDDDTKTPPEPEQG